MHSGSGANVADPRARVPRAFGRASGSRPGITSTEPADPACASASAVPATIAGRFREALGFQRRRRRYFVFDRRSHAATDRSVAGARCKLVRSGLGRAHPLRRVCRGAVIVRRADSRTAARRIRVIPGGSAMGIPAAGRSARVVLDSASSRTDRCSTPALRCFVPAGNRRLFNEYDRLAA